jgi:uroporphyrinogen decarboxylase
MTRRDIMRLVYQGQPPPYVPWVFNFTQEAFAKLAEHYGGPDQVPRDMLGGHFLTTGQGLGDFFEPLGHDLWRDGFGVVWDRSVDKDIGVVKEYLLPEPTLANYRFPDPLDPRCFAGMAPAIASGQDGFRVFTIGFSLYERAWTLRGMENLMLDFHEHPAFVHELLGAITDHHLAQLRQALKYDIDAVYFGDDWGSQRGLQMGPRCWREFIKPHLRRLYAEVRHAGRLVTIHSCGKVDELFDDLIEIGVNGFNPFQPEVMDVAALMQQYRGRLTFIGGLSTQQTLPYGTVADVRRETRRLLAMGRAGSYVFSPAHAVEGDVPLANMLAFIEEAQKQPGYPAGGKSP